MVIAGYFSQIYDENWKQNAKEDSAADGIYSVKLKRSNLNQTVGKKPRKTLKESSRSHPCYTEKY